VLAYQFPADQMLHRFKYGAQFGLHPFWLALLVPATRLAPRPDLVVPAPLADERLTERGFNQAALLAKGVAAALAVPVDMTALTKTRTTAAQVSLAHRERTKNVRDAFASRSRLPRHVAIVDDVMTSGATMNEMARCLKASGVVEVSAWVVLRTLRERLI
jgi:ComF family protein